MYVYLAIHLIIILRFLIREQKNINKKNKITDKKWMFDSIITSLVGIGFLMYMPIQVLNFMDDANWSIQNQIISSIIFALFSIFSYILVKIISVKVTTQMSKLYPEYNLYKKA
ncbi:hypothetical protein MNBD_BACTEROID02-1037 [hydrothermal vent metagenome]|uniref:Uncharacterized protein n=1 Tax=hydrothermal vent metagenome TaxID=652676 RepID=A0A3B0R895_9ZZZZ